MDLELLIRAPRVVSGERGEPEQARAIGVSNGRIEVLQPVDTQRRHGQCLSWVRTSSCCLASSTPMFTCASRATPNGRFATATRAAAAGGVTTLVDMPLDSVPATVRVESLAIKRSAAAGQRDVDVGSGAALFPATWAPRTAPRGRGARLQMLPREFWLGRLSPLNARQVHDAVAILRDLGWVLLVHAESGEAMAAIGEAHGPSYAGYLATRPRGLENLAVAEVIEAARTSGRSRAYRPPVQL